MSINDDRAFKSFEREIKKDLNELDMAKKNYANSVKESIGREINDFNSYIKKEPSFFVKIKNFISRVFRHL